jgi:hypothetical protein
MFELIDFDDTIGKGFQGVVYGLKSHPTKVVKVLKLKCSNVISQRIAEEFICPTYYASQIGVGPKVYGIPFVFPDGLHIAVIMDKVCEYTPNQEGNDDDEIIELFETCIRNKFLTYDYFFGKTSNGRIVIVDFGVSHIFKTENDARKDVVDSGLFEDAGIGYYSKHIETHFEYNTII